MFAFLLINDAKSQCKPDCDSSDWIGPQYIDFTLPGCDDQMQYQLEYYYRVACNTWHDYYISKVETFGSTCLDENYGGDLDLMLQDIMEELIMANPAGFPPNERGECEDNWRVMEGSCWRPESPTGTGMGILSDIREVYQLIPCQPSNECCLEYFTVCISRAGVKEITHTGTVPPEDPDCLEVDHECVPVCGSVIRP